MADAFALGGQYQVTPTTGVPSLAPTLTAPIDEAQTLQHKSADTLDLTTDSPVSVPFQSVLNATVVIIKVVGGKVRVRVTSTDGGTQAIPVDSVLILLCKSVPVTAVDLTRVAGTPTTVSYFIGEAT